MISQHEGIRSSYAFPKVLWQAGHQHRRSFGQEHTGREVAESWNLGGSCRSWGSRLTIDRKTMNKRNEFELSRRRLLIGTALTSLAATGATFGETAPAIA